MIKDWWVKNEVKLSTTIGCIISFSFGILVIWIPIKSSLDLTIYLLMTVVPLIIVIRNLNAWRKNNYKWEGIVFESNTKEADG